MGKDIFLDNGKKVQGSMTRYWKQQKDRERKPKGPRGTEKKEEMEDVNKTTTTNSDKWKTHQENMITNKYKQSGADQPQKPQLKPVTELPQSHDVLIK